LLPSKERDELTDQKESSYLIHSMHREAENSSLSVEFAIDFDVHGITVPAGSMIAWYSYCKGMDPTLLNGS
jgi:hypothetical protein